MIQNIMLQLNFFTTQNDKFLCLKPAPPGAALFCLEPVPESAPGPGPWSSGAGAGAGAAKKSGGSATQKNTVLFSSELRCNNLIS